MTCRFVPASPAARFIASRTLLIAGCLGGFATLAMIGGGCSPASSSAASDMPANAPLIVASDGTDISNLKPARADSAAGRPQMKAVASAPPPPSNPFSSNASMRKSPASGSRKSATTAASPAPTQVASDECRLTFACSKGHEASDPGALQPHSAHLQAIMKGSQKTALIEGQLYQVGDHFGARECTWTVADINAGSARLEKAQTDRTFAVTLFVPGSQSSGAPAMAGGIQ